MLFISFTLNVQFGLLFLVPVIPVIILIAPQLPPLAIVVGFLCLVSHPVLLFVMYWGYQALGCNDWLRVIIYSADQWSSLLWPFVTLQWIPLLTSELGVVFSRNVNNENKQQSD